MSDNTSNRKEKALRLVPNLGALNESLQETSDEELVLRADETLEAGSEVSEALEGFESVRRPRKPKREGESQEVRNERKRIVEAGKRAVSKLNDDRGTDLTREEQTGLEAIVLLIGRPAILVQGGRFANPPDEWSILARPDVRPRIETTVQSVGRIEVTNHPGGLDWIGTGFLVADDVVMTNRHVAAEFAERKNGKTWKLFPKMNVRIDYVEEFGGTTKAEFKITDVIGVHDQVDMALLRVSLRGSTGAKRPKPLPLAATPNLKKQQNIYVIGYPASDSRRNDPIEMRRIFENIFDVKRLQPGKLTKITAGGTLVEHDCSTLGGNSGSCVLDLETHRVIGLHFSGKYLEGNTAVALSKLVKDPLIKKAQLQFV